MLNLALKDLLQIIRDWKSGLFLVVMPVLFTLFFGMVMGSALNPDPEGDPRLPVGLVNRDLDGSLRLHLEDLLASSSAVRLTELTQEEAAQRATLVREGELAAVLVVPQGYSQGLLTDQRGDPEDQPVSLEIVADQSKPSGETAATALETAANRLGGAVETAHLSAEVFDAREGFQSEAERQSYLLDAVERAIERWKQPPLAVTRKLAVGEALKSGSSVELDGFVQASSGMIVQFAIFGLITSAMVLVLERKAKTLQRLLITPISRAQVIAGHLLAMFVVVFIQEALLVAFGQWAFGVNYLRQPWAVLIMMAALALWAASLGLLISALAKGEEQVVTLSLIAMFLFASLGGAWFPLEVAGETFASIGHIMPTAWAMDGFQNLLMRGLGLESVLLPAGVLSLYTLGFFGLAVWRFEFE
jgi:ABC-2 type transport system permease protein